MSTKTVLEEQMHRLEEKIGADEAWIEYVDNQVLEQSDTTKRISARLDEIEAKMEDFVRILERELGTR